MAYMCTKICGKECDGCGDCKPKETGVIVTATIKVKFMAYGEIEEAHRNNNTLVAARTAEELVDALIDEHLAGNGLEVSVKTINRRLPD